MKRHVFALTGLFEAFISAPANVLTLVKRALGCGSALISHQASGDKKSLMERDFSRKALLLFMSG